MPMPTLGDALPLSALWAGETNTHALRVSSLVVRAPLSFSGCALADIKYTIFIVWIFCVTSITSRYSNLTYRVYVVYIKV